MDRPESVILGLRLFLEGNSEVVVVVQRKVFTEVDL